MPKAPKIAFILIAQFIALIAVAEPVHVVKFYKFGSKILFNAKILDSNEITVLFDPGTYAYMHSGTAQKHQIEYSETGTIKSLGSSVALNVFTDFNVDFEGYTHTFEKVKSQVTAPYLNKRIDMVFGKEWADKYIIEINYENFELRLHESNGFTAPEGFAELEVVNWNHYPMVKAWFTFDNGDSAEFNVELDIGSEVGFKLDRWATRKYNLDKVQKDRGHIRIFGSDGRGLEGMLTRVKSIQIEGMRKTMVRGGVFEDGYTKGKGEFIHGMVGQDFLQWYDIVFDRWHKKIYYKPVKFE